MSSPRFVVFVFACSLLFVLPSARAVTEPIDFGSTVTAEVYKRASGDDLWIYRFCPPDHDPQRDRRPAAVFFFGGGWTHGTVRQFEQHARYLASRGMVAFVADYRVKSRQGCGPDACVADGKSAVRWIRSHAERLGIDPARIAAGGGSAGGQVAAAAGICDGLDDPADPRPDIRSKPNALLLFNPVYDNGAAGWGHERVKPWFPAISPAHNISADDPPTIVFLGTADPLISCATAEQFDARLRAAGVRSELWTYEGQPHGFFNESKNPRCFIDTILKMDDFLVSLGWLGGQARRQTLRTLLRSPLALPNIVVVVCDDLGFGDVQCLNPHAGKIPTPHADRLATEGMIFTDAHAGSSVCTPTRYGLLTGRHCWRTRLQHGVVTGFAPCLIDEKRPTVASFLRQHGYSTAIVGKWHLNWQYADPDTGELLPRNDYELPPIGATIPDGPLARGFDSFHGFHHAREMRTVIEGDRVIAYDEEINTLSRLTSRAVAMIETHASEQKPFFLYVPLSSPHTPILPAPEWQGRSGLGPYGDFVMQTDHALGEIMAALEHHGLADDTLLMFTSDNGCSKAADIDGLAKQGHHASGPYRGSKADLWDGGHRVPCLVRWPGTVPGESVNDQTICLTDLFATVADIVVDDLPEEGVEDSVSFLGCLIGSRGESAGSGVIHHSISGHFAYRRGRWKLLLARGSGGWSSPREKDAAKRDAPAVQLYDMDSDGGERRNVAADHPDIVADLLARLQEDIARGRTTPGPPSPNDIETIEVWKSGRPSTVLGEPGHETRQGNDDARDPL
jgi:arylsulfatase A